MKKKHTPRNPRRRFSPRTLLAPAALLCACADPTAPTAADAPQAQKVSPGKAGGTVDTFVSHSVRAYGAPTFTWVGGSLQLPAGAGPAEAARATLQHVARSQGMSASALTSTQLRAIHDSGQGPILAQFEQRVENVEVFHAGLNIAMSRDLKPVAATGTLAKALRPRSRDFGADARSAVAQAVAEMTGTGGVQVSQVAAPGEGGYGRYAAGDAPGAPTARAKRVWFPQEGGLVPAYYVEVEAGAQEGTDSRLEAFVVSGLGGVLFRKDLTVADSYSYRVWADKDGRFTPWDSPQGTDFTPHPKGMKDGVIPAMKAPNLVALANAPFSKNDPWLAPGAMELKGNNAFAYADIKAPDGYQAGSDVTVTRTAPGVFDRTYDPNTAPTGSPESMQAITTNLFYIVNFMHDYFYDAGWDEKSLNPQQDNYGRGGTGGDPIKAEAQDYGGRNNANASTPADGAQPRIQMYLWDTSLGRKLTITQPMDIAGDYDVSSATFGPKTFDATQSLVVVDDNVEGMGMPMGTKTDGCETPFANATDVMGKAVIIDRGLCPFTQKVLNAQAAGARAVIIANNAMGLPPDPMGGTPLGPINIPVLGISQADANKIKAKLMGGAVRANFVSNPVDRDGSLDTTIVSHEWGHILSNRLVGNGTGLSSLQAGGMGEGWSDFVALLTIVRAEDVMLPGGAGWAGTYAVGSHAAASKNSFYEGIRRYPYSTDKTKNPLTFKHIQNGTALPDMPVPSFGADGASNAEVHNTGEVWTTMLWECYAALLKDGRYTFVQANQKMREYLVAGLKLTPNAPTILEARDAILAAAYASEPKDYDVFWQAFARRGAGTGAKGPDRTSRDNTTVTESFMVGNDLAFVSATLDDSVKNCDKDGILDAGETGNLKITIRNTGGGALTASKVTVSADNSAVTFPDGASVTFPRIDPYKSGDVTIKVSLKDKDVAAQMKFNLTMDFSDPMLTDPRPIQQKQSVVVNYDDLAESSATDSVDAKNTLWSVAGDMMLDGSIKWDRVFEGANGYWHIADNEAPSDQYLVSPPLLVGDGAFGLSFKHRWTFETQRGENFDGGVVEISKDNGMTWTDLGDKMSMTGYGGQLSGDNPALPNRQAFVNASMGFAMGTWVSTTLDLGTAYKGQTVLVRFRVGTDEGTGAAGWDIDELAFTGLKKPPFPSRVDNKAMCLNHPPKANAGQDQTVMGAQAVTLMGSGTDEDGDPLTYRWTQSGGAMITLTNATAAQPTFTAPDATDTATELSFTLVVNDGKVDSAPAKVTITVQPKDSTMMPPDGMNPDMMDKGCACNVPGRGAGTTGGAGLGLLAALGMLLRLGWRRRRS